MPGQVLRTTSSPTSSVGRPSVEHGRCPCPAAGPLKPPARSAGTGSSTRMPPPVSVPPRVIDDRPSPPPTVSNSQCQVGSSQASPVEAEGAQASSSPAPDAPRRSPRGGRGPRWARCRGRSPCCARDAPQAVGVGMVGQPLDEHDRRAELQPTHDQQRAEHPSHVRDPASRSSA